MLTTPELDDQLITRKDHSNAGYMISEDTVGMALSSDISDVTTNCSTGAHLVNNSVGKARNRG